MARHPFRTRFGLGVVDGYATDSAYAAVTGTPKRGDHYLNTTELKYRFYDGTQWGWLGQEPAHKVDYVDVASLTLPSSAPFSPDGTPVVTGDDVLFTALSSSNGRVYRATVSGPSVTWTLQATGEDPSGAPSDGDQLWVRSGTARGDTLWFYDGTSWSDYTDLLSSIFALRNLSNLQSTDINVSLLFNEGGGVVGVNDLSLPGNGSAITLRASSALDASPNVFSATSLGGVLTLVSNQDFNLTATFSSLGGDLVTISQVSVIVVNITDWESGEDITPTVNGVTGTTVPFNTSNNQSVSDLATVLAGMAGIASAIAAGSQITITSTANTPLTVELADTGGDGIIITQQTTVTVTISDWETGESVTPTVNGVLGTAVPFNTDNNTSVADLASSLSQEYSGGNVNITAGTGTTSTRSGMVVMSGQRARMSFPGSTDPSSPAATASDLYYNTVESRFRYHDGTSWRPLIDGPYQADYQDASSTTLPSSTPYSPDGTPIANGDLVLFTNLSTGAQNNRVYRATVNGSSITWYAWDLPSGTQHRNGDMAWIRSGSTYGATLRRFNGTTWFSYVGTLAADVVPTTSLSRSIGSSSLPWLAEHAGSYLLYGSGPALVASLELGGTTPSSVLVDADLKTQALKSLALWTGSDATANATATGTLYLETGNKTAGTGGSGDILFRTGTSSGGLRGVIAAAARYLRLDGATYDLNMQPPASASILDNQASPVVLITHSTSVLLAGTIEYYMLRDGESAWGAMRIAQNGTVASLSDTRSDTGDVGITFTADISGGNLRILYESTSTGSGTTLIYWARWMELNS